MTCQPRIQQHCLKPTGSPPGSTLRSPYDSVQVERTTLLSGRRRGKFRVGGQAISVSVSNTGLLVFAGVLLGGYYLAKTRR